jgi:hypothetical protein
VLQYHRKQHLELGLGLGLGLGLNLGLGLGLGLGVPSVVSMINTEYLYPSHLLYIWLFIRRSVFSVRIIIHHNTQYNVITIYIYLISDP